MKPSRPLLLVLLGALCLIACAPATYTAPPEPPLRGRWIKQVMVKDKGSILATVMLDALCLETTSSGRLCALEVDSFENYKYDPDYIIRRANLRTLDNALGEPDLRPDHPTTTEVFWFGNEGELYLSFGGPVFLAEGDQVFIYAETDKFREESIIQSLHQGYEAWLIGEDGSRTLLCEGKLAQVCTVEGGDIEVEDIELNAP